jgi:hypothetical protein
MLKLREGVGGSRLEWRGVWARSGVIDFVRPVRGLIRGFRRPGVRFHGTGISSTGILGTVLQLGSRVQSFVASHFIRVLVDRGKAIWALASACHCLEFEGTGERAIEKFGSGVA